MKGDFSRLPSGPPPYSGVWMQQGRVQLDADWNEQVALGAHRDRMVARDAMGGSGAPAADPGFRISLRSAVLCEQPGQAVWIEGEPGGPLTDPAAPFTVEILATLRPGGRGGPLLHAPGVCGMGVEPDGSVWMEMGRARISAPRAVRFRAATWIAGVWDGAAASLYVNGALLAAGPLRPGGGGGGQLALGAGPDGEGGLGSLDGLLGEARLWREALDAGRVRASAGRAPSTSDPALAGLWLLDEGQGEAAGDATGARHARLGGGEGPPPRWLPPMLHVGAGRFWVDGVACENPREVAFGAQPDLPGARAPSTGDFLVYLDVWERWLSPVEDPSALEVALDGADTAGRTRTVWQVRTLPVHGLDGEADPSHAPGGGSWSRLLPPGTGHGRMAARGTGIPAADNRLYRVEIHRPGGAFGWPRPAGERGVEIASIDRAAATLTLRGWAVEGAGWEAGQAVELWSRATDRAGSGGAVARVTAADAGRHRLTLDAIPPGLAAGDDARVRPLATWVWSRDNGSAAWAVAAADGATVSLDDLGRAGQQLARGDWVEALDDDHALRGQPGRLCRVAAVDPSTHEVTLHPAPGMDPSAARHPLLRRWEAQPGGSNGSHADAVVRTGWAALDETVEVRFDPAAYRTGDYWTVPVREVLAAAVEWPMDASAPASLPPQGIVHAYAPLALVRHRDGGARVHDLRRVFTPAGDEFVRRTGPQRMEGPLTVEGDVATRGTLRGRLERDAVHTATLADLAVTTEKLADRSVTADKLAVPIGGLPAGACVLGRWPDAPQGFHARGAALVLPVEAPAWRELAALPLAHPAGADVAVLDGVVWACSGTGVDLWRWTEAEGWGPCAPPLTPRRGAALCAHEGMLYLAGGWGPGATAMDTVEAYDPACDAWSPRPPLPTARGYAGAASLGGALYLFGGRQSWLMGSYASPANEAYDAAADGWTARRDMGTRRLRPGAAVLGGRIYAVGGERGLREAGRITDVAESYDPETDRWRRVARMLSPRTEMGTAALDGALYVAGGRLPDDRTTSTVERYDPETDVWSPWVRLPAPTRELALAGTGEGLFRVGGQTPDRTPLPAFQEIRAAERLYLWCRD